jgi:hypothetical protein
LIKFHTRYDYLNMQITKLKITWTPRNENLAGTAPDATTNGGAATAGSTDTAGQVTGCMTSAGCLVIFATPYASAPFCLTTLNGGLTVTGAIAITTTTTDFTVTTYEGSNTDQNFFYTCIGHQ